MSSNNTKNQAAMTENGNAKDNKTKHVKIKKKNDDGRESFRNHAGKN